MLLLLVGPSGAGKTAIISSLLRDDSSLRRVGTYSTRRPRHEEVDRVTVSSADFEELSRAGAFAWETRLFGTAYGTLADDARLALRQRQEVFLLDFAPSELDKVEAQRGWKSALLILPPNKSVLVQRLLSAGRPERIKLALQQYAQCETLLREGLPTLFNTNPIIVNEDLHTSVLEIQRVIARLRREDG